MAYLGVWVDPHLYMNVNITGLCKNAFYYLYNIRHIRNTYLSRSSTESLVHSLITSRVNYCNILLYGLPKYQVLVLQRVFNASSRLVIAPQNLATLRLCFVNYIGCLSTTVSNIKYYFLHLKCCMVWHLIICAI